MNFKKYFSLPFLFFLSINLSAQFAPSMPTRINTPYGRVKENEDALKLATKGKLVKALRRFNKGV